MKRLLLYQGRGLLGWQLKRLAKLLRIDG